MFVTYRVMLSIVTHFVDWAWNLGRNKKEKVLGDGINQ